MCRFVPRSVHNVCGVCACMRVCVCYVGILAEPLRQVVLNTITNGVKFLSCHRNKDGDLL